MEHSPEPWGKDSLTLIEDADGVMVAMAATVADRDRIIACVNALAGIPTEDIERVVRLGREAGKTKMPKKAFLLKISDGDSPPHYSTLAGFTLRGLWLDGRFCSSLRDWQIDQANEVRSSGEGVFTGTGAETMLRTAALEGSTTDYQLAFDTGELAQGRFLVTLLDYAGDYNGERKYKICLANVGPIEVVRPCPAPGSSPE